MMFSKNNQEGAVNPNAQLQGEGQVTQNRPNLLATAQDEARLYKKKYGEEQCKWLMVCSKNNQQPPSTPSPHQPLVLLLEQQSARHRRP
jgi:hypothetical protein